MTTTSKVKELAILVMAKHEKDWKQNSNEKKRCGKNKAQTFNFRMCTVANVEKKMAS